MGIKSKAGSTGGRSTGFGSLGRALIVEDDAIIALDMADALTDGGAEKVVICPSISAALAELERFKPEVLVLDVRLADRDDGWTLAELVTQLNPVPPLIVFSTGLPESIPAQAAALGHILAKPFHPEELVRLVRLHRQKPGLIARLRGALSL
ncbi:response regulator [Novosphingobium cyanobacteriorum]|uniref:Response regulator n=1 Tax=Novosphingobium cyanobacteriorum TaxID=3024215 RepID=A0ABT6CID5_9SPHN|nr:response regulator [Novosphingobium cyanobacteriorum]MDF8333582.1 response regulator [Novosphingobium cyanobacteriorum]